MIAQNVKLVECQNCKASFTIDASDFAFYKKMQVPPPTWCPECRLKRRLIVYNKRTLYKRRCQLCGKETLSMYHGESPITVFCNACWWLDQWEALSYGREYDFSQPFFLQVQKLLTDVPWMALGRDEPSLVNSDYCNAAGNLKNCYLVFFADYVEDSFYCDTIFNSKDCIDCFLAYHCEQCYQSVNIRRCFGVHYSVDCEDSYSIVFSKNLVGCSDCFGCINLRKKQYCIFNKQYTKEAYRKAIGDFSLDSYRSIFQIQNNVVKFFLDFPIKYFHGRRNVNVSGDYIENCKNTLFSFLVMNVEDSKWCFTASSKPTKDSYDYSIYGDNAVQIYESVKCGYGVSNLKFCNGCWSDCRNIEYSTFCMSSHNLFGCVGLRNKKYCILNKQYSKEEYGRLVPKIIEHMNKMPYIDKKGRVYRYGEFFPPELSSFAYNEIIAQENFPLTKEQAEEKGYRWKDTEVYQRTITLIHDQLPDHIKDVPDSIVNEVISCQHSDPPAGGCNEQCTTAFRVIPQELKFYRQMNLSLPRLCPNCRHYQRLKQRNSLKLWQRTCQCQGQSSTNGAYQNTAEHFHKTTRCPNEFETSYAPDRKEIVYCEKCYVAEVA